MRGYLGGSSMIQSLPALVSFLPAAQSFTELYWRAALAPANALDGNCLDDRDPQVISQLLPLLDWFYRYYFQVETDGWEHIPPESPVLLVGSHNGGLTAPDLYMMLYDWAQRFGVKRPVYALMNPKIWQFLPGLARLAAQVGAIRAQPRLAIAALKHAASLLIYPGGAQDVFRPYAQRNQIHFHGRHGFIKLALEYEVPIIPLISHGAHATLVVLADLYPQLQFLHEWGLPWPFGIDPEVCPVFLGWPWGMAVGPLPNLPFPVQIHTRVCRPITFDRYGLNAAQDSAYVDACYTRVVQEMQAELDRLTQEHKSGCC